MFQRKVWNSHNRELCNNLLMRESSFQSPMIMVSIIVLPMYCLPVSRCCCFFFPHTTSEPSSHCYVILMLPICNEFHKLTYVQMIFQSFSVLLLKKKKASFFIIYVQKALSCTNPYWGFFFMLTSQFPSLNAKFSSKKVINKKWAMHIQPLVSLNFSVLGKKRSQCIWIYFCEIFILSFVQKLLIWLSNASNLRILSM